MRLMSEEQAAKLSAKNRAARRKTANPAWGKVHVYAPGVGFGDDSLDRSIEIAAKPAGRGKRGLIHISLPWPPSVNHYWRRNAGWGMHISDEGKAYQNAVGKACRGLDGVMGRVTVNVVAYPPDKRKRDLDNIFKALLDALNSTGMIEDDSLIDDLHIVRAERVAGGRVDVTISRML